MRATTSTIFKAMRILAYDIQSDDGVATAAILEAADRLEEQENELNAAQKRIKRLNETLEDVTDKLDSAWGIYMEFKEAKP
jgi:hypothetical protein